MNTLKAPGIDPQVESEGDAKISPPAGHGARPQRGTLRFWPVRTAAPTLVAAALLLGTSPSNAATLTWSADIASTWSNPSSWTVTDGQDPDGVPDADDTVVFDDTSAADATIDAEFDVLAVTISPSYTGVVSLGPHQLGVSTGFTVVEPGRFDSGSGTLRLDGGSIETADPVFHLTINSPQNPIAVRGPVGIFGDLHIQAATALSGGVLVVFGALTVDGPDFVLDDSVVSLAGTEDQDFGGNGNLPHLDIVKPSGTINFQNQRTFERVTISGFGWDPQGVELTAGTFEVLAGGLLAGDGTFHGPVRIFSEGALAPPLTGALLIDGDLTMEAGSSFVVETIAQDEFILQAQGTVTGSIALNDAELVGFFASPPDGQRPVLLNEGGSAIQGTFVGVEDGATVLVGDFNVAVYYSGGDGNDLVLESPDFDEDTVPDDVDNCPDVPNPDQLDLDMDFLGDECDPCPNDPDNLCIGDIDSDGVPDEVDNCPEVFNDDQSDFDADGLGDVCDPCPDDRFDQCMNGDLDADGIPDEEDNCVEIPNEDQSDIDNDGLGDLCDPCPDDMFNECEGDDMDEDGIPDGEDNCPADANEDQSDLDDDGLGDVCDPCPDDNLNECLVGDIDDDGVPDDEDNCPDVPNLDQTDVDDDGVGNACDPCPEDPEDLCGPADADSDGIKDDVDNCVTIPNEDQADADDDGQGDACDPCPNDRDDACVGDMDRDGVADELDNCVETANPDQSDLDGDGLGDVCDDDIDGDGVPNETDTAPMTPTSCSDLDADGCDDCATGRLDPGDDGPDADGDGLCDDGDPDDDGDTVDDDDDNCPTTANTDQLDTDADGIGDVCDPADDRVEDDDADGVRDDDDNCPGAANSDQVDIDNDGVGDVCDPRNEITGELVGSRLFGCNQSGTPTGAPWGAALVGALMGLGLWRRRSRRGAAVLAGALALTACAAPVALGPEVCFDPASLAKRPLLELDATLTAQAPDGKVQAAFAERNDGKVFGVSVPEGTGSVALTVRGGGSRLVVASVVQAPSGLVVWDLAGGVEANRTHPGTEPYTILLPSQPGVVLEPGTWRIGLVTDDPNGAELDVAASFVPIRDAGTLDLNLVFVGIDGLSADEARQNPVFQKLLRDVEIVYETAGVSFGEVAYLDVAGDDAKRFRVTSVAQGELEDLLSLAGAYPEGRLNLFFVAELEGDAAGYSLFGQSGGVPGPATGATSGVVVSLAALDVEPETIQVVMAHEMGHFLGLYHTTERNGAALRADGIVGFDPLCDTPSCPDPADANGNRMLSSRECAARDGGNLMFGLAEPTSRALTPEQARVLRNHPLVK